MTSLHEIIHSHPKIFLQTLCDEILQSKKSKKKFLNVLKTNVNIKSVHALYKVVLLTQPNLTMIIFSYIYIIDAFRNLTMVCKTWHALIKNSFRIIFQELDHYTLHLIEKRNLSLKTELQKHVTKLYDNYYLESTKSEYPKLKLIKLYETENEHFDMTVWKTLQTVSDKNTKH